MSTETRRRRWPPRDRQTEQEPPWPDHGPHTPPAYWTAGAPPYLKDFQKALENLAPSVVIGEQTFALDALGQAAEQYRAPFAALSVVSLSAAPLILSAGPRSQGPPGPGPGTTVVPPFGHIITNVRGNAWSLYGGLPGDLVTVQAFSKPLPPAVAYGAYAVSKVPYTNLNATGAGVTLTASGNSGPVSVNSFSTIGLQATVGGPVTGAGASLTLAIDGIDGQNNLYPLAVLPPITGPGSFYLAVGPGTANPVTPAVNAVTLAASGAASYNNNAAGVNVTVTGGTVTVIAVNGTTTGLTSGTVFVPAGGTLTITYSAPPTLSTAGLPVVTPNGLLVPSMAEILWTLGGTTPSFGNVQLTLIGRE